MSTDTPTLTRPPGPQLGPLELARLLRRRQMTTLLERAARQSPEVAHFRIGFEHAYLVSTPELVRELFGPLGRVTAKGRGLEQARLLLGDGLLTSEGELHRRQRRLIQPAFHHSRIPAYEEVMRVEAAALPQRAGWAQGAVRDLAADMADLTLRIVGRALFATDLGADSPAVAGALHELLSRFQRVMLPGGPLLNRVPLPSTLRVRTAIADLNGVVDRLIAEHRAAGRTEGLLADLLAARDEDGRPMPAGQVRDEVLTLVLAGHETTANALAWSWVLLDRHPQAAARLHEEVDTAPAVPTVADLPWTRAVVAETMRLYPPAWVVGRRMLADARLGGWTVPARSIVMASQWVTHRDPRWWPDATAYRPERWIADGAFDEAAPGQPRGAYFPFGMGRRVCVGESFAWTEAVLVLAALARDWAPALLPGARVDVLPAVTLRPRYGLPATLHRRG
ncbi:MAG TPA: cytochrome P450 [Mycobacteriales bacterium]|nr:cytochrome P450 [Mycobacteriales bacterium]